jgi:hypothetical protein
MNSLAQPLPKTLKYIQIKLASVTQSLYIVNRTFNTQCILDSTSWSKKILYFTTFVLLFTTKITKLIASTFL